MGKRSAAPIVAVVVALAALLAACGSTRPAGLNVVSRARTATAVGTARVSLTATVQGGEATSTTGTYDFGKREGSFDDGSSTAQKPSIVIGSNVYSPMPTGLVPTDKQWIEATAPRPVPGGGQVVDDLLEPTGFTAPGQVLDLLATQTIAVTRIGQTELSGTPVTQYRLDLKSLTNGCATNFGSAHPVDLWVDAQGRARQLRLQLVTDSKPSLTSTITVAYSDFGVPVTVAAPPAATVESLQELRQQFAEQPGAENLFNKGSTHKGSC